MAYEKISDLKNIINYNHLPCTKPWTTLEERSIYGNYTVCCWQKSSIGRVPQNSNNNFMKLWNNQANIDCESS